MRFYPSVYLRGIPPQSVLSSPKENRRADFFFKSDISGVMVSIQEVKIVETVWAVGALSQPRRGVYSALSDPLAGGGERARCQESYLACTTALGLWLLFSAVCVTCLYQVFIPVLWGLDSNKLVQWEYAWLHFCHVILRNRAWQRVGSNFPPSHVYCLILVSRLDIAVT